MIGGSNFKFFFIILLEASYKIRASNTIELSSCVVHVLCGFSTEFLKTLRESSLLFEDNMKMTCCFIVSFR